MNADLAQKLNDMTPTEKFELYETLSLYFDENPQHIPITEVDRKIANDSLEQYRKNPESAKTWTDVRKKYM